MISIIIPALNEEQSISHVLDKIHAHSSGSIIEVMVVDGGSSDATMKIAEEKGAKVIRSAKPGRAIQMNHGAAMAKGEVLYFLHADSIPPPDFDRIIQHSVEGGAESGCFRLQFDDPHPVLNFYTWFTGFDVDLFRFGDQSLYIRASLFKKIGAFREDLIVMEDQEIIRRIKREATFKIEEESVITSARKYRGVGVVKLQLIFALILTMYYLGVGQDTLVSFYKQMIKQG